MYGEEGGTARWGSTALPISHAMIPMPAIPKVKIINARTIRKEWSGLILEKMFL
jgi:hypothetical protein